MVDHTIKAHMEVAASASMAKRRKPDVIAEIAAASRAVDQIQCADSYQRFAHRIVAAVAIIMKAAEHPEGDEPAAENVSPDSVETLEWPKHSD